MATIKSFTDLSQSKILSEILPLESADMCYMYLGTEGKKYQDIPICAPAMEGDLCVWSLAALISIIPQEIFDGEYIINITEGWNNRWILTYDDFEDRNHPYYGLSTSSDNLVDACYEMIIRLHELNLL